MPQDQPGATKAGRRSKEEIAQETQQAILSELVTNSPAPAKRVFETFKVQANKITNMLLFKKLELPEIISAAVYLGLLDCPPAGKRPYKNRETLTHRTILKIESLFPAICADCNSTYQPKLEDKPPLTCWSCYRHSHNCQVVVDRADSIEKVKEITGCKWLCSDCTEEIGLSLQKMLSLKDIGAEKPLAEKLLKSTNTPKENEESQETEQDEDEPPHEESNVSIYLSQIEEEEEKDEPLNGKADLPDLNREQKAQIQCRFFSRGKCRHGDSGTEEVDGRTCPYLHKTREQIEIQKPSLKDPPSYSSTPKKKIAPNSTDGDCQEHVRYGRCKHGITGKVRREGKICNGNHPKLCPKLRKGGFGKNGCEKGYKCEFIHPKVCRGSLTAEKICPDPKSCKFFHVVGTSFGPLTPTTEGKEKTEGPNEKPKTTGNAKSYADAANEEKRTQSSESLITSDFLKDLVREVKEGFSAQARQMQQIMFSMNQREMSPPMNPLCPEYPRPATPEQFVLPGGMGMNQPMYSHYRIIHPSQGSYY